MEEPTEFHLLGYVQFGFGFDRRRNRFSSRVKARRKSEVFLIYVFG